MNNSYLMLLLKKGVPALCQLIFLNMLGNFWVTVLTLQKTSLIVT